MLPVHLPLGISFFTFQAISYLVDVYRRDATASDDPSAVALYISMFPQLIAGPIVRYRQIADQITQRSVNLAHFADGVRRFIVGLGKKMLIADTLGGVADPIFAIPQHELTTGLAWLGVMAFTFQIYFDFSGYSDMAIGLGRMLGFRFPENFDYPYIARSMREFWRRWHISLSTWFRDYLYLPLGGNRGGRVRTGVNLVLVFLLCGLWHGASWNFVIWGLFHGAFLAVERTRFGGLVASMPSALRSLYVLSVVVMGWVFFRAETLPEALAYLTAMMGFADGEGRLHHVGLYWNSEAALAFAAAAVGSTPMLRALSRLGARREGAAGRAADPVPGILAIAGSIGLAMVLFACLLSLAAGTNDPFIYFRF